MRFMKLFMFGIVAAIIGVAIAEEADDRQTATSLHYVSHELDTRQNKLSAGTNAAITYTNSAGNIEQRAVKANLTGGTTDTSLPMVNAVNAGLNIKQDDITTIDDHTAVTYTGQTGAIGAKGIYQDTGNYAAQSDNLIDAKTFNAALKNGLDSEFICTGYKPGTDLCWLWEIHNNGNNPINIYDPAISPIEQGTIYGSNGQPTDARDRIRTGYINVSPSTQYAISWSGIAYSIVFEYDDNDNYLGATIAGGIAWTSGPRTITTRPTTAKIRIIFATASSGAGERVTPSDLLWLQIEPGANATPRPYTTLVPDGYTPVEYIESTGTQYIDTGLIADSDDVKFDLVVANVSSSGNIGVIIGGREAQAPYKGFLVSHISGANAAIWLGENKWVYGNITTEFSEITFERNDSTYISNINGTTSSGDVFVSAASNVGIQLFHNMSLGSNTRIMKLKKAYIKVGNSEFNGIPVIRNSDNAVGLYDTVSNTFFTNAATSGPDFTAGEPINNIVYLPQGQ